MQLENVPFLVCVCIILANCSTSVPSPSSQAIDAERSLRDLEYTGVYLNRDFYPCGRAPRSQSGDFSASVTLDRDGNIIPRGRLRVSGQC